MTRAPLALVVALALSAPLGAQEHPHASTVTPAGYLQEMPTAERVLADITGTDSVDTRARRYTATGFSKEALYVLTEDHVFSPGMSPEEARLFRRTRRQANPQREFRYWAMMPTPGQVKSDIRGTDALDTMARLDAATLILHRLVALSAEMKGKNPWPARETELKNGYIEINRNLLWNTKGREVLAQSERYRTDTSFRSTLLRRYFDEAALREIEQVLPGFASGQGALIFVPPGREQALMNQVAERLFSRSFGVGAVIVLLGLYAFLGWLPRRRTPNEAGVEAGAYTDGRFVIEFWKVTGEVLGTEKRSETHVSSSGGGGYRNQQSGVWIDAPIAEIVTRHEFWLKVADGSEKAFQLSRHDIPLRTGQRVTLVGAQLKGKETGQYVIFVNHTERTHRFLSNSANLYKEFKMNRPVFELIACLSLVALIVLAFVLPKAAALFAIAFIVAAAVRVLRNKERVKAFGVHLERHAQQASAS